MFLTIFISNIISWVVLEAIFSIPPCSWVFLLNQDLHFKIHVQTKQGEMGFLIPLSVVHANILHYFFHVWQLVSQPTSTQFTVGWLCSPILDQNILASHNRGREVHPGLHFTPQYVG